MNKPIKTFNEFTNLYSLSKTLRFELRPVGETKNFLATICLQDENRDKWYHETMKPILDELHNVFIVESLEQIFFSIEKLEELESLFLEKENLSKNKKENFQKIEQKEKEIKDIEQDLRNIIGESYNRTAEKWKERYQNVVEVKFEYKKEKGYEIITGNTLFGTSKKKGLLEVIYAEDEEKLKIVKEFKGFSMYFDGFNTNRENYYSTEEKHTAVAYRIINENLFRFIKNRKNSHVIFDEIQELREEFFQNFSLENYQNLLSQEQIDVFNEKVIGEINYRVNIYCQKNKKRLPKLDILYKQIGSQKKDTFIFSIKEGSEWQELRNLQRAQHKTIVFNKEEVSLLPEIQKNYQKLFSFLENFDLEHIYFNKQALNTISSYWFVSWYTLGELLQVKISKKTKERTVPEKISLLELKNVLENIENTEEINDGEKESSLFAYFKKGKDAKYENIIKTANNAWQAFLFIWQQEIEENFNQIQELAKELTERRKKPFIKQEKRDKENGDSKFAKKFCDAYLAIERMVKYHKVKENNTTDIDFYGILNAYLEYSELNKYYNAFRNYISQKPYSEEKIKLNFENPVLLGGFSDGQEKVKGAVILRKIENRKEKYFLGILKDRGLFRTDKENPIYKKDSVYSRLILKVLKMQTLTGKGFVRKFDAKYSEMNDETAIANLKQFIKSDYLNKYPKLEPIINKQYSSKKELNADVKEKLNDSFSMKFEGINEDLMLKAVEKGDLYLFEIFNKDFSENKKNGSQENIHTKYWRTLFSKENLENPLMALAANGEIFFRKGQRDKLSQRDNLYYKSKKTGKQEKVLEHRRFAEDKILFHIPISINFKSPKNLKFNKKINTEYVLSDTNVIIGIDRGEKHLIYISVINQKNGEILEQKSLNILKLGKQQEAVDFHKKLKEQALGMMEARKNWKTIGAIKNFKEGYLSYVIHEIYKLVLKYNAVVVLEDLNAQFKAKRTAQVEYSLYKKFELTLAKKLNHLILKDKQANEVGGVLKALQLTPKIEAGNIGVFEKSKQWGILYYVRPNYTSITDPVSGWRKHKYISNSATVQKIKDFFEEENIQIFFDNNKQCFAFSYKHNGVSFTLHAFREIERFHYNPKIKEVKLISVYDEFEKLLGKYKQKQNILLALQEESTFRWKQLVFLWNLLNQIRNTDKDKDGNENDFLQSPVWSDIIKDFFDSREVDQYKKDFGITLPENGDANGAYNTGRKGIIVLNNINKWAEISDRERKKVNGPELFVSNEEWDNFVQK